jgi:hypothetical protein
VLELNNKVKSYKAKLYKSKYKNLQVNNLIIFSFWIKNW